MQCTSCGAPVAATQKFCTHCGTPNSQYQSTPVQGVPAHSNPAQVAADQVSASQPTAQPTTAVPVTEQPTTVLPAAANSQQSAGTEQPAKTEQPTEVVQPVQAATPTQTEQPAESVQPVQSASPTVATSTTAETSASPTAASPAQPATSQSASTATAASVPDSSNNGFAAPTAATATAGTTQLQLPEALKPDAIKRSLNIRAIGQAVLFGMLAAIIITLPIALAAKAMTDGVSSDMAKFSRLLTNYMPVNDSNPLQIFIVLLGLSLGGSFTVTASNAGNSDSILGFASAHIESASGTLFVQPSLAAVLLILCSAFGVYKAAIALRTPLKIQGLLSSVAVGVIDALIMVVLGFIGKASVSGLGVSISMSILTFRTIGFTFIFGFIGAFIGFALAQYAPDASNVFTAGAKLIRRSRGPVRSFFEMNAFLLAVLCVAGIVLTVIVLIRAKSVPAAGLFPLFFGILGTLGTALFTFGGVTLSNGSAASVTYSIWGKPADVQIPAWGWIILVTIIVSVALVVILALRTYMRNSYDPYFGDWQHSWQMPVATAVLWLVIFGVFSSTGISGAGMSYRIAPSLWSCAVLAVLAACIEVLARTVAPQVVSAVPALAAVTRFAVAEPVPQEVVNYIVASKAVIQGLPHWADQTTQADQATQRTDMSNTPVTSASAVASDAYGAAA